jgi:probable rRNA maturation factor
VSVDFTEQQGLHQHWERGAMRSLVESILKGEASSGHFAVSLHLVDDAAMQELNRSRREVDASTDVLSFPLLDPVGLRFVLPPDAPLHLGDVVVSFPRAQSQAEAYGHSLQRELAYLVAHGVLHLLGYDHEREDDRAIMRSKEETALGALGHTR